MPNPAVNSDHLSVLFSIEGSIRAQRESVPLGLDFDFERADYDAINASLLATDWNQMFEGLRDVEDVYSKLMEYLLFLAEVNAPRRKRHRPDRTIANCVQQLQRALLRCDIDDAEGIQRLQRKLDRCLTRQRCLLEQKIALSSDSSRFYKYMSGRLRTRDDLAVLVDGKGGHVTDDQEKANLLCETFEQTYREGGPQTPGVSAVLQPNDVETINDVDLSEMAVYCCLRSTKPKRSIQRACQRSSPPKLLLESRYH